MFAKLFRFVVNSFANDSTRDLTGGGGGGGAGGGGAGDQTGFLRRMNEKMDLTSNK